MCLDVILVTVLHHIKVSDFTADVKMCLLFVSCT